MLICGNQSHHLIQIRIHLVHCDKKPCASFCQLIENGVYQLDKLPRGRIRGKLFFGTKVAALNFRKLVGFLSGTGRSAPNPLLAAG